ncbi:MAG: radical SAM protein [Candidatus Aenigmatarchaeota archaeon]
MKRFRDILPITNVLEFKKKLWFTEYAFRINEWFKGNKKGPIRIDAEITRQCNLNCIFCARRASKINLTEESKKVELSKEKWVELARESGEIGVKNWSISGNGEPMMRPDILIPTMKMLQAYDIFGELTTNGTLWKDNYIREVVNMQWDSVCISIDGPNSTIHDYLRKAKGSFRKATETAKKFAFWKKKLKSELPTITINVVLNKLNWNKLAEMVKLAHKIGADAIFVEPMIIFSPLAKDFKLTAEQFKELPEKIAEAREMGEKYGVLPTISTVGVELEFDEKIAEKTNKAREILIEESKKYEDETLSLPCYAPWYSMMIRADGTALPCGELEIAKDSIRNKSLREVWFGEVFEKSRKEFIKHQLPETCDKCRPNTINDIRQMRRAIMRGKNIHLLQKEILDLLEENRRLRKEIYMLKNKGDYRARRWIEEEKELIKLKNSLTFKMMSKIGSSKIGKLIKKCFRAYV